MAGKIFINYRRNQSVDQAQHLATVLSRTFGSSRIFIDVRGIDGFSDWLKVLKEQVAGTAAMISLIGPDWADARDDNGERRLDHSHDFVRLEIVEALTRDIPVLPVLLNGASPPLKECLPEDMRGMLRRQAMELHAKRFPEDAKAIAAAVRKILADRPSSGVPIWSAGGIGFLALVAGVCLGPFVLTQIGAPFPWVARTMNDGWAQELKAARREAAEQKAAMKLTEAEYQRASESLNAARQELSEMKAKAATTSALLAELRHKLRVSEERATEVQQLRDKLVSMNLQMKLKECNNDSKDCRCVQQELVKKDGSKVIDVVRVCNNSVN